MEVARDWRRGDPDPSVEERPAADAPSLPARVRAAGARGADLAGALLLLLAAWPLVVGGMAVVFAAGGRPLFFGHVRVRRGGKLFRCWKLRTMRSDAEERLSVDPDLRQRYVRNGFKLRSAEDPRLIPSGRWLRRFYVDEVPQLWNVLRGDMSLVGPRPVVPSELELFGVHAARMLRHRPGLFGEWTSRGRRRPPYPERVRVEMEYVNDPSLNRSLRILARSFATVLRGQDEDA